MPVFNIDVRIYGTAYIRAADENEALEKLAEQLPRYTNLTLPDRTSEYGEVWVSGKRYDDPDLPTVSLSPVFTIHGPDAEDKPALAG